MTAAVPYASATAFAAAVNARLKQAAQRTGTGPSDQVTRYISKVIPPGPNAGRLAEKARTRLLNHVDEQRNPRAGATVNYMLDKHFELFRGEPTTLETYRAGWYVGTPGLLHGVAQRLDDGSAALR